MSHALRGISLEAARFHSNIGVRYRIVERAATCSNHGAHNENCETIGALHLMMLAFPKARAPWVEQAAGHVAKIGEDAARERHVRLEDRDAISIERQARMRSSIGAGIPFAWRADAPSAVQRAVVRIQRGYDVFDGLDRACGARLACNCCARFASSGRTWRRTWSENKSSRLLLFLGSSGADLIVAPGLSPQRRRIDLRKPLSLSSLGVAKRG